MTTTPPTGPGPPSDDTSDDTTDLDRTVAALRREREWRERVAALPSHRVAAGARATGRRARRVLGRVARRTATVLPADRAEAARERIDQVVATATSDPLADPRPPRARQRVAGVPGRDHASATDVVFLLVVLEPVDDDLDDLLAAVREVQREADVGVVVATDSEAFHLFRHHDLLFEHLPPRARWRPDLEPGAGGRWDRAIGRRLDLLVDEWRPDAVLALDPRPDARDVAVAVLAANVRAHLPPT